MPFNNETGFDDSDETVYEGGSLPDFVVTAIPNFNLGDYLNFEEGQQSNYDDQVSDIIESDSTYEYNTQYDIGKIYNYNLNGTYTDKIFRKYNPETKERELAGVFVGGYFYPPDSVLPLGGIDSSGNEIKQFPLLDNRPIFERDEVIEGEEGFKKYLLQFDFGAAQGAESIANYLRYAVMEKSEMFGINSIQASQTLQSLLDHEQLDTGQVAFKKDGNDYNFLSAVRTAEGNIASDFEYEINSDYIFNPLKDPTSLPLDANDPRFNTPSSNVPSNFTEKLSPRTYRDPATGSVYYDNPLLDTRLNEIEKDRIHNNLDYQTSLDYELTITKPINPYEISSANEVEIKKDKIWDNVNKAVSALYLQNPTGKVDKGTIFKAATDVVSSSIDPAVGILNMVAIVQDLTEGLVGFVTNNKEFEYDTNIPSAGELAQGVLTQFGISPGANYEELEQNLQRDYSRNFNRAYNDGLIDEETYAVLNKNYQDFRAGYGNGNTEADLRKALDPTFVDMLDDAFGGYHNQVVLPIERSSILLDNIVANYHEGTVTKGDVLDAVSAHKMMVNGMGSGVTTDIYSQYTGNSAPFMLEARVNLTPDFTDLATLSENWQLDFHANLVNQNIKYDFDFDRLLPIDSDDSKYDEFKQWSDKFSADINAMSQLWGRPVTDNELANLPQNYPIYNDALILANQAFMDVMNDEGLGNLKYNEGTYYLNYAEYKEALNDPSKRQELIDNINNSQNLSGGNFADHFIKKGAIASVEEAERIYSLAESAAIAAFEQHYVTQFDPDEQLNWYYTLRDKIDSYDTQNPIVNGEVRVNNDAYDTLTNLALFGSNEFAGGFTFKQGFLNGNYDENDPFKLRYSTPEELVGRMQIEYDPSGSEIVLFDYEVIEKLSNDSVAQVLELLFVPEFTNTGDAGGEDQSGNPGISFGGQEPITKSDLKNSISSQELFSTTSATTITPNAFATAVNDYLKLNPNLNTPQFQSAYGGALDVLTINQGLVNNNMTSSFTIADAVDVENPGLNLKTNLNLNNYVSLNLNTGEVQDKYKEDITELTAGGQGLVGDIKNDLNINLPDLDYDYGSSGFAFGIPIDDSFDLKTFEEPTFNTAAYLDGQSLPDLPKKENYKEAEKPPTNYAKSQLGLTDQDIAQSKLNADFSYHYKSTSPGVFELTGNSNLPLSWAAAHYNKGAGVRSSWQDYKDNQFHITSTSGVANSDNSFIQFQNNVHDKTLAYFKNEINSIDFNYATSPQQVAQAIQGVMVKMHNEGMVNLNSTYPPGPTTWDSQYQQVNRPSTENGSVNTAYQNNEFKLAGGKADINYASGSWGSSSSSTKYELDYSLTPGLYALSGELKDILSDGDTFGQFITPGNIDEMDELMNGVFKPINMVRIKGSMENPFQEFSQKQLERFYKQLNETGVYQTGSGTNNQIEFYLDFQNFKGNSYKHDYFNTSTNTYSPVSNAKELLENVAQDKGFTGDINTLKIVSELNFTGEDYINNYYHGANGSQPGSDLSKFKSSGVNPDPSKYVVMQVVDRAGNPLPDALVDFGKFSDNNTGNTNSSYANYRHSFATSMDAVNSGDNFALGGQDFSEYGDYFLPGQQITEVINFNSFYEKQNDDLNELLNRPDDFVHPYTQSYRDIVNNPSFTNELNELIGNVNTLNGEVNRLNGLLADANESRNRAVADLDVANKALNKAAEDLAALGDNSANEAALTAAQQKVTDAENKLAIAEANKAEADAAAAQAKTDAEEQIAAKEIELSDLQKQLDDETAKSSYNETLVNSLANQIQQATQAKTDAQSQLELVNSQLEGTTNEQIELMGRLDGLLAEKTEAEEEVARLTTLNTEHSNEEKRLTDLLGTARTERDNKEAARAAAQEEANTAQSNYEAEEIKFNNKSAEYDAVVLERDDKLNQINEANQVLAGNMTMEELKYKISQDFLGALNEERANTEAQKNLYDQAVTDKTEAEQTFKNEKEQLKATHKTEVDTLKATNAQAVANAEAAGEAEVTKAETKAAEDAAALATKHAGELDALGLQWAEDEQGYLQKISDAEGERDLAVAAQTTAESAYEGVKAEYDALVISNTAVQNALDAANDLNISLDLNNQGLIRDLVEAGIENTTAQQALYDQYVIDVETAKDELRSTLNAQYEIDKKAIEDKYNKMILDNAAAAADQKQTELDDQRLQIETQAAEEAAAAKTEADNKFNAKVTELNEQFAATLQEQLTAARADEQLIASGNLAAREAELEEQYNADKAAAIKAEQDKAQLALNEEVTRINNQAAEDAAEASRLAQISLDKAVDDERIRVENIAAQTLEDRENELESQYQINLKNQTDALTLGHQTAFDAQTIAHDAEITQISNTHSATMTETVNRLNAEKDEALRLAGIDSDNAINKINSDHAEELAQVETDAQARYDEKLAGELQKKDTTYEEAAAAADAEASAFLESETNRLNAEKQTALDGANASWQQIVTDAEKEFDDEKKAWEAQKTLLEITISDLTPPIPLYQGPEGQDFRIKDPTETAYLDNLAGTKHNRTNKVVFLPTMYKYENNVVYDPAQFNDEDLWASDTIQELYYNGFPQTDEAILEFIRNNPDAFPDFDENGLPSDARVSLIESIQNGIMDAGFALQQISGGSLGTSALNLVGIFFAGGVPIGNILNAAGDLFGPDNAIELAGVIARQINNSQNFGENKNVDFKVELDQALIRDNIEFYDPDDYDDPNNPFYGMDEEIENPNEVEGGNTIINTGTGTINTGPGGTSVTGTVSYDDVNLGDPTDYLYQLLRILKGETFANNFKDKGLADPEGFAIVSQYMDDTAIDAAIRSNAVDEAALFGTDEQRGSIEIGEEAAQKIQDIANALRDDQALSDIELITKYGADAAKAIRELDPDRLEQRSMLEALSKKRMQEALNFSSEATATERALENSALELVNNLEGESLIEKAVRTAALGQLDPALTENEALMQGRATEFLQSTGKLSPQQSLELQEKISSGLRKQGRLDDTFGIKTEMLGRIEAELDKERSDLTFGAGLMGTFEQMYGDRLLRGAGLGTTAEQMQSSRRADNRADLSLASDLTTQLYNNENVRLQQGQAKDVLAANLQNQYDSQSTRDLEAVTNMIGITNPYGADTLSQATSGNIEAPTNLNTLIGMGATDYSNAQNFSSTMEGIAALRQGGRDYSDLLSQGARGYTSASQTGRNQYTPTFENNYQGFGDLGFGEKLGVITSEYDRFTGLQDRGGFTGDPNTNILNDPLGALNQFIRGFPGQ